VSDIPSLEKVEPRAARISSDAPLLTAAACGVSPRIFLMSNAPGYCLTRNFTTSPDEPCAQARFSGVKRFLLVSRTNVGSLRWIYFTTLISDLNEQAVWSALPLTSVRATESASGCALRHVLIVVNDPPRLIIRKSGYNFVVPLRVVLNLYFTLAAPGFCRSSCNTKSSLYCLRSPPQSQGLRFTSR